MDTATITIREAESTEDYRRLEELQARVWDMQDSVEVVPLHLLITAEKNGGLVLCAFDGDEMIGFLFGFLGLSPDGTVKHCSHMMGMLPPYQGLGIGARLKAYQRQFVLAQGFDLITWTYDPLEAPNAYLNIAKLGTRCNTYLRNVYGDLRAELNRGLPTDRFQVDWRLRAPSVVARFEGGAPPPRRSLDDLIAAGAEQAIQAHLDERGFPVPLHATLVESPLALVEIPSAIQRIKAVDMALAQQWRETTRSLFESYFAAGYTVVDFIASGDRERRRTYYLLTHSTSSLETDS